MYPPLYILNNGMVTAPVGEFEGTWYSPELINAIDNFGVEVREITMTTRFERSDDLFHKFIDSVYKLKERQDALKKSKDPLYSPALRDLAKLILNSAYGQFGMRDHVSQTRIVSPEEAQRISEIFPIEIMQPFSNGQVLIGYKQVPNPEILASIDKSLLTKEEIKILSEGIYGRTKVNVAIASAVTANARLTLVNAGLSIRKGGGVTYKCATDSWYHTGPMPAALVHNSQLGLWKKEHNIDYGIFTAANVYMLNPNTDHTLTKCGGVRKEFKGQVSLEELQQMLLGQPMEKPMVHWSRPIFGHIDAAVAITQRSLRLLPAVKKRVPIYEAGKWVGGVPIKLQGTTPVNYNTNQVWEGRFGAQPGW
jgi:hypothetical protein